MVPRQPIASSTLECPVLEWAARATSNTTSRTDAARHHDEEPMEFILSSNWVLQTEGVNDFYGILHRRDENLEIEYDPILHGFRVKCLSYDEVRIVTLVKEILDQLVQKETKNGLETSAKIIGIDDWRKNKCQTRKKIEVSEKYTFPRDVAACSTRGIWNVSESSFKKGTTTNKLLPESALAMLQKLTSTVLVTSSNKRTVYIGASEFEKIRRVKQKLDTLARFFSLTPRDMTQVVKIFLYNEGDRSTMGEYRFVSDGNDRFLRSYILDRFDWPHTSQRYPTIFHKSVMVRLNPNNDPWEEARSLSNTVLPIVKAEAITEEFGAFKLQNWRYPAKDAVDSALGSDISSTQLGSSLVAKQSMLGPKIETWVSRQHPHASAYSGIDTDSRSEYNGVTAPHIQQPGAKPTTALTTNDHTLPRYVAQANPSQPSVCSTDEAAEHSTCSRESPVEGHSFPENSKHLQTKTHDPFQYLIGEFRRVSIQPSRGLGRDQTDNSNVQASQSPKTRDPRLVQDLEDNTRSFHVTMRQKAGAPSPPKNVFPEFDTNMMMSINESLTRLMAPLRMWPGIIDFRIELGRFYFLNVKKSHIQEPRDDDDEKYYKLSRIQNELNKRHTANEKLCFTRVLTSLGADANYIARISDHSGNQIWKRPTDGRSSTYEFTCRFKTIEGLDFNFVVEIDATKFTSSIREFKPSQNCFAVHCTKRTWDFQLVLSVSQDLNNICGRFAEDLLCSLRVMPRNDRIPELEVSYDKSYGIEVLAVRTRNKACCVSEMSTKNTCSPQTDLRTDVQRLYISELWEMDRLNKIENEHRIRLKFACYKRNNERSGMPPVWYEAILKSDTLSKAFEQNETLELGNEVEWVSEDLLKSGSVEALIQKAADMVRNMDGVGYWNDNHQTDLLRSAGKPSRGQDVVDKFW
ncbi:hypothetical protein F4679DRAFT_571062 [Xylaria curta]|nr:hypothetical protein F4679DRAFT_571062 [Xylaria curta]